MTALITANVAIALFKVYGLQAILKRIASNDESGKLTHKEVRAYARCMLPIVSYITVNDEIKLLMAALSASGLPHYDRSFIASRILKLLEELKEDIKAKRQSFNPDNF